MRRLHSWRVLFVAIASLCVGSCASPKVYSVHAEPFPARAPSMGEVADLIHDAGERHGWTIEPVAPGKMRGTYTRGRHVAVVSISYSAEDFSLDYLDSSDLRYRGDSVHKVYNEWVRELEAAIKREANFRLRSLDRPQVK